MKRLHEAGEQHSLQDTPYSDKNRILKAGAISLLFHIAIIIFLIFYLMGGGSNGGGGGGFSVYRVTIHPLSSQSNSNTSSLQALSASQVVFAKTHIQKDKEWSKEKQPPAVMASAPESTAQDQVGTGKVGTGPGGEGDGTGSGWNLFGLRGFGNSRVSSPRYIENPKPAYPLEARQQGCHGRVLLKVEVLQSGRVGEVKVERSSGYTTLDQSALNTVKKWRFIPAKRGKIAIHSWVNIMITFQLRDSDF